MANNIFAGTILQDIMNDPEVNKGTIDLWLNYDNEATGTHDETFVGRLQNISQMNPKEYIGCTLVVTAKYIHSDGCHYLKATIGEINPDGSICLYGVDEED